MAGIKLVMDTDPDKGLELAWRVAQDLGFGLTPIRDGAFLASKGHLLLSMIAGAAAPHCQFKLSAKRYGDHATDLVLERAGSWTSGLIGKHRIKNEADALMVKVAEAITQNGGTISERKEI